MKCSYSGSCCAAGGCPPTSARRIHCRFTYTKPSAPGRRRAASGGACLRSRTATAMAARNSNSPRKTGILRRSRMPREIRIRMIASGAPPSGADASRSGPARFGDSPGMLDFAENLAKLMKTQSIEAYDLPERVASYDADLGLMHPNRHKMMEVVLEVLPFPASAAFTAVDLGVGTGFFSQWILTRFPNCRVIAVDGAASMIEVAKARLGALAGRVDFRIGDFRKLKDLLSPGERGDLVYSAFALHHLTAPEKLGVVREALAFLNLGGWFLNAD